MTAKDTTAQKATGQTRGRRRRMIKANLSLIAVVAILVTALPTAVLGLVGMVPTLVTLIIDLTPGRFACRCVAPLNLAGVFPFLRQLWLGGNDMAAAVKIIADPDLWLVSYGAAAFGWALFLSLPSVIAAFSMLDARRRVYALRDRQHQLIREWGKSIGGENWRGPDSEAVTEADEAGPEAEPGDQAAG